MPSPFPGMDPYLEHPSIWPDLHLELIRASRAILAPAVAPNYYVAVEERAYLVAADAERFVGRPDVAVVDIAEFAGGTGTAVLDTPVTVTLPEPEEVTERFLEVRDTESHKVVTVIEILSPTNKTHPEGREKYLMKRNQVIGSMTSLVEIDLLRAGDPMPMNPAPGSHYRCMVSRSWERYEAKLYSFNVQDRIPRIPIPLRKTEKEPMLDPGELLAQIYDQVRYDLRVNYDLNPVPPLDGAASAWAHDLMESSGV
ncbi:MAG: DUF4058 family protein [Planctomycetota bacterium]|nr:DUF4058 family protein [Planctomycetota bacterium]